jgi:hypothetical protein
MTTQTIRVTVVLPADSITDYLLNAHLGGSNYWGKVSRVYIDHPAPSHPRTHVLDVVEREPLPSGRAQLRLTKVHVSDIVRAFGILAVRAPHMWDAVVCGKLDRVVCDLITQYAVFGEEKYG